jgi:DNA-binding transcriptional LysR family regulator
MTTSPAAQCPAQTSERCAARALQAGTLVPVLPGWRLPDRVLYAVYPDARFIPQRVRSVVGVIEQLLPGITTHEATK